jgi:formate dehydrogenase maturation protein FdhE
MAAVLECFHDANLKEVVRRWLRGGDELSAVERFLARAAAGPVLEAEGRAAGDACEGPRSERHCPTCGGLPQLSYFAPSPDNLVTAHRYLECARCATSWAYPRLTCAACGERESGRLRIFGEVGTAQAESSGNVVKPGAVQGRPAAGTVTARFPHLRIDGCGSCSRYLLNVDLERDGRAVPAVDEIAAIPLDLYAKERGLSKVVPNLMGF